MMKTAALTCILAVAVSLVVNQASIAAERLPIAKPGEVITMTAKNPDGRLCPVPACGQGVHTGRIPAGTKLRVLQVYMDESPLFDVPWYGVEYTGKKGWVSEVLTDRWPEGIGKDFCPRNPKGPYAGCDKR